MAYCTLQDLVDRIGEALVRELSDIERTGEINETRVTRACEDAAAVIDGWAKHRYDVPFASPSALIKSLAVDIAVYNLFKGRGYDENTADRAVVTAWRAALVALEKMSEGKYSIGVDQPPKDQGAKVTAADRVFTRSTLEDF